MEGIAALLRPNAIAPHFVLEGAALGQEPFIRRRAAVDMGLQPGTSTVPKASNSGASISSCTPYEIVHLPAPSLVKISSSEADTEEREPKEL